MITSDIEEAIRIQEAKANRAGYSSDELNFKMFSQYAKIHNIQLFFTEFPDIGHQIITSEIKSLSQLVDYGSIILHSVDKINYTDPKDFSKKTFYKIRYAIDTKYNITDTVLDK
jgi:hypothetical protein